MTAAQQRLVPGVALLGLLLGGVSLYLLTTAHPLYALLPAPLVGAALLLGRFPYFAYYLFVFMIPFEFFTRLSATQKELTVAKFLGLQLILTVALLLLFHRLLAQRLRSNLWPLFALFLVASVISALLSPYPLNSLDDLRRLLTAFSIFALTLFFVRDRGYSRVIPSLMIWGVTLNYALFLLEFVFKLSFPWSPIFPVDVSQPAYALPSGYSIYFVFLIPLLLHRLSFGASTREKALAGALLFVTFSGVVFLGSRAALFSVVVALLLLLSQYLPLLKPRRLGFLFAVAGLAVALALLLIPQQYWVRQKTVVETKTDASVAMRISYVQAAWQYFRERPLFGYGPGSFKELYAVSPYAIQFANKQTGYVRYAHNTFLEVLVGTGLAGFLLFGVAVAASIRNFARAASLRWQRGDHAGALLDRAYLTAFLVNLFYFFFISYFFMKTFWIFLALSQIALNRARAGSPPAPPAA